MKKHIRRTSVLTALVFLVLGLSLERATAFSFEPSTALDPSREGPLRIVDRKGRLLRSVPSPHRPGRAAWVPLEQVGSTAILTLIASEDQAFFEHSGVDPWSVLRACWLDLRALSLRYGASTLSMQLVRMIEPDAINHSFLGKLRQARAALALERALTKREILEQYLNRAYFGHGAYGIAAAAQTYFARSAASLSDAQATLLMTLVRAPSGYDLLRHRDRAVERRDHLLTLLVEQGRVETQAAARIRAEDVRVTLAQPSFQAGHFVDWVIAELSAADRAHGGTIVTTLDLDLQRALEHRTAEHVAALSHLMVEQAGVVVLDTRTGDVRAMVGSRNYEEGNQGQVNIATWRRYPGSALKPFVYAAAIAEGASPATVAYDVYDVPSTYRTRDMEPREYGPARFREALAGSYNLAAVHTLEQVGVAKVMTLLKRAGVGELAQAPDDYGLRLALGSTQVRLVDLAASYGAFVSDGLVVRPRGVLRVERADDSIQQAPPPERTRALSPQVAWLVMDMLSDPEARRPRFGWDLPFDLPYPVVAKTGTARGFSDTVAVVATSELTVAAWTGRFDGRAMEGLSGMGGAAYLARAALLVAAEGRTLSLPQRPDGLTEMDVCADSGLKPGPFCTHHKHDYALTGHVPTASCTWHQADGSVHYPSELRRWAERAGKMARTEIMGSTSR